MKTTPNFKNKLMEDYPTIQELNSIQTNNLEDKNGIILD